MKTSMWKTGVILSFTLLIGCSQTYKGPKYQVARIADSDYQWTGLAISQNDRMFVNFPTWDILSPFKVAEIKDGKAVAYPDEETNQMFSCVQSVYIDQLNRLWILDPANPQFLGVVSTGAKLYEVNLATNKIVNTYTFNDTVAPNLSYLNDIRVDTNKNIAYITDSQLGGIVVLNLTSGKAYRALDQNCPSTQANLNGISFKGSAFWNSKVNSDGIELSANGDTLYYAALTGSKLYKIATSVLCDSLLSPSERETKVLIENDNIMPTDGLLLSDNKLYMAHLPLESIFLYDLSTHKGDTLQLNEPVRWADSFAKDSNGNIYFTTSQINYPNSEKGKFYIYKLSPVTKK